MEEREAILLLSQIPSVTPAHLVSLQDIGLSFSRLIQNPKEILNICHPERREGFANLDSSASPQNDKLGSRVASIPRDIIQAIEDIKSSVHPSQILKDCRKKEIQIITFFDAAYPKFLKEIHKPPLVLYMKGELIPEDEIAVSIVGARYASAYGMRIARRISYELAEAGVTVVSGLARGIDGEAHKGALEARGRTIAVLGSGIDVIYPKEHEKLFSEISESGVVMSEFPLGTPPLAFNFPQRNRIIAGLSQGILVAEAHYRSGSLITAKLASEEGREVYALPGPVDSVQSNGTNQLLKEGAKLVTSSEDILADLRDVFGSLIAEGDRLEEKKDLEFSPDSNPEEEGIVQILGRNTLTLDEIQEKSDFDFSNLCAILTTLELKGKIRKLAGGFYELA